MRLAITDHDTHRLIIDDITDRQMMEYNEEEEAYIKANYPDLKHYSWDWITDIIYFQIGLNGGKIIKNSEVL